MFSLAPVSLHQPPSAAFYAARLGVLAFWGLSLAGGCSPPSPEKQTGQTPPSQKRPPSKTTAPSHVTEDESGRKFLDGVPYDVWFDDPLSLVENSTATVGSSPSATDSSAPLDTPPAQPPDTSVEKPPAAGSSSVDDWEAFITAEQLQEETKKIRNQLKTLLQTPGVYSGEFEQVKLDGAVLAALAVIGAEQKESLSWKQNALYIRDYTAELFEAAKGPGKANYDKSRSAFENLESVWSGSIPVGAAEPAPDRPLNEVASRFYLMRRMKVAFEALKSNINTAAKIQSEQDLALQETAVLSALSQVVSREGYTSTDEPEYQEQIQSMIQSALQGIKAVKEADFPGFQDAMNRIEKTCNECHVQYRNG